MQAEIMIYEFQRGHTTKEPGIKICRARSVDVVKQKMRFTGCQNLEMVILTSKINLAFG